MKNVAPSSLLPDSPLVPMLKWAGGKRWLLRGYPEIFPRNFERYVEPFAGSAAVFFHLRPTSAVISDTNRELIESYAAVRNNWSKVAGLLKRHSKMHSNEHYYRVRAASLREPCARAARLLYLNRTCFNGLYRVNRQGHFNVPIGSKETVLLSTDDFDGWADALRNATLLVSDFESVIDNTGQRDFLFVDPPYTVTHNLNGFVKYNEVLFSWDDQIRLANALSRALLRGVQVVATNADHIAIKKLYQQDFRVRSVSRQSLIGGTDSRRGNIRELLITSK